MGLVARTSFLCTLPQKRRKKEYQHKVDMLDNQYKVDMLDTLKNIEKNTAVLNELVLLVRSSNLQQETLTELVGELLAIAKAKIRRGW